MLTRICDATGEEEELRGGKTCETGHFICRECIWRNAMVGKLKVGPMKRCPLCGKPLK